MLYAFEGQDFMTTQFDFSAEQWDHIASTPVLVGYAVAKAEDSGFFGSIKETRTVVSAVAAGIEEESPAKGLVNEAAAAETDEQAQVFQATGAQELADAAVQACTELSSLLGELAEPEEAAGYKAWVLTIATEVAEAAKEGGVRTSAAEAALIERLEAALGG